MQKHLIVALACASLVFSACDKKSAEAPRDFAAIKQSGVLKWGSDDAGGAPYEFRDPQNPDDRIGFEVDIADELSKRLGVKIEFVQTDWAALVPALQRGDFDIAMAGIEITPDRQQVVAFSRPYYIYTQQLVVRANDDTVTSLTDCHGKKVGTLGASAAERILQSIPQIETVSYDDNVRPYDDLAIGRIDAVLLDLPIAVYHAQPRKELKFAGEPFAPGEYAIAVRKDTPELKAKIDEALVAMIKDGTLQRILEKWKLWNEAQSRL